MLLTTGLLLITALAFILFLIKKLVEAAQRIYYVNKLPGKPRHDWLFGNGYYVGLDAGVVFKTMQEWNVKYFPIHKFTVAHEAAAILLSPEDVEKVCSNSKHNTKAIVYKVFSKWLKTGLLTSEGSKWQSRRKILTPAFHFNILQNFIPIFNDNTQVLVQELYKTVDEPYTEINSLVSRFTLKSISETSMGTKLDFLNEKELNYRKAVHDIGDVFVTRALSPWLHYEFPYLCFPTYYREKKLLKTLRGFTKEVIDDRERNFDGNVEARKKRLVMLDLLLSAKLKDGDIDNEGIHEEVDTFMFEGHDTIFVAISFALMLLACNPEAQERIVEEMREVLIDVKKQPSFNDLQELKYMEMCIKEVLRLYPSVTFVARQLGEDITTKDGYKIKKNTTALVHIHGLHHSSEIYPDPEKFDPDRFLPESVQGKHPFSYLPFSAGPRNCIGQRFALLELKAVLCGILANFVLHAVDTPETIELLLGATLRTRNEIKVKFTKRDL